MRGLEWNTALLTMPLTDISMPAFEPEDVLNIQCEVNYSKRF